MTDIDPAAAMRLKTGYWERETLPYDPRQLSAPWCARVAGIRRKYGEIAYDFGTSTARNGSAGLLAARCAPGEIVAWGQRQLRGAGRSVAHEILLMLDDGSMQQIDRTAAYLRLRDGGDGTE